MSDDPEILAELRDISSRLARIEERSLAIEKIDRAMEAIEKRTTELEKWRERLIGISMAIGALSSLVTGLLLWVLTKFTP